MDKNSLLRRLVARKMSQAGTTFCIHCAQCLFR
jgi:hypothetical protein